MKHSFATVQQTLFFASVIVGCLLFGSIILPFILPIFWAIVIAIVSYPLYTRILHYVRGSESTASALTILAVVLCIGIPVTVIGSLLAREAIDTYYWLAEHPEAINEKTVLLEDTLISWGLPAEDLTTTLRGYSATVTEWVANEALSVGKATGMTMLKVILTLYLLFYMLRDGKRIVRFFEYIMPLGNQRERHLFHTFSSITRAIMKGTIVTALLQGIIGGILLWVGGSSSVLLLAALMTILACIPGVGPTLIWLPAGIFQLVTGNIFGGLIILIGGFGIISMIDNVVRPILVGRDTALPDALILVSILGGLVTYGIPGLIIGPVAAGLALALLEMFASEYSKELEQN